MRPTDPRVQAADSYLMDIINGVASPEITEINQTLKHLPYTRKRSHGNHRHNAFSSNPEEMNRVYNLGAKYKDYEWQIVRDGKYSNWQLRPKKSAARSRVLPAMTDAPDVDDTAGLLAQITLSPAQNTLSPAPAPDLSNIPESEFDLGEDTASKRARFVLIPADQATPAKFSPRLPTYYHVTRTAPPANIASLYEFPRVGIVRQPNVPTKYKKIGGRYSCIYPPESMPTTKQNIATACQIYRQHNPLPRVYPTIDL